MPRPFDPKIFDPTIFDALDWQSVGAVPVLELFNIILARSKDGQPGNCHELTQRLTGPADQCKPLRCTGTVVVHIAGDALSVTGYVERSTSDPGIEPNWTPQGRLITGNPAGAGLEVMAYTEPTKAWWRFRANAIVDGIIDVTIAGGSD